MIAGFPIDYLRTNCKILTTFLGPILDFLKVDFQGQSCIFEELFFVGKSRGF